MNNQSGISVIICTWNRAESLHTTLKSLNSQNGCLGHEVEVVVVDNNSSDQTKQIVEAMIPTWHLGKLWYLFEPRQGKQFALNSGIDFCTQNVIAFSDDDIIFPSDWASEIIKIFIDHPIDLMGGKTLATWPVPGPPHWYHQGMAAIVGAIDLGAERLLPAPASYAPAGANMVVRRSLFQRIGKFSETHFRHMDYEFGMRCARMNGAVAYDPRLLVYAPVDSACLTKRYFRRWAFKAGVSPDQNQTKNESIFLGAPRWIYRQILDDLRYLVFNALNSAPAERFNRELRIWRGLGRIGSRWHERLWPATHSQWVEKYSQKKKNVY